MQQSKKIAIVSLLFAFIGIASASISFLEGKGINIVSNETGITIENTQPFNYSFYPSFNTYNYCQKPGYQENALHYVRNWSYIFVQYDFTASSTSEIWLEYWTNNNNGTLYPVAADYLRSIPNTITVTMSVNTIIPPGWVQIHAVGIGSGTWDCVAYYIIPLER